MMASCSRCGHNLVCEDCNDLVQDRLIPPPHIRLNDDELGMSHQLRQFIAGPIGLSPDESKRVFCRICLEFFGVAYWGYYSLLDAFFWLLLEGCKENGLTTDQAEKLFIGCMKYIRENSSFGLHPLPPEIEALITGKKPSKNASFLDEEMRKRWGQNR